VSIWRSVPGPDPVIYDADFGDTIVPDGWIDVAIGWQTIRLIVRGEHGETRMSLSADGARELERRLRHAREGVESWEGS
jgi:hypothetical protein